MKSFGGMRPKNGRQPDFTIGEKQLDGLSKQAAEKMGRPADEIKKAVEQGRLSDITSSLSPSDAQKLEEVLSDEKKLKEILSSKKAKMLLSQLLK